MTENQISKLEIQDYTKLLRLKPTAAFILFSLYVFAFTVIFLITGGNLALISQPLYFIVSIISIIPAFVYTMIAEFEPLQGLVYHILNSRFNNKDPHFNTEYFTNRMRQSSDFIINNPDGKYVVIKLNVSDFFDRPFEGSPDSQEAIKINFNRFLILNSSNVEQIIFRVINKKLNLSNYFDDLKTLNSNRFNDVVYKHFFDNFIDSYNRMTATFPIPDYEYYVVVKFKSSTRDTVIESLINTIISQLKNGMNLDEKSEPRILRSDEILNYLRALMITSNYTTDYSIPIITDTGD
jgi:hypothetical protein